MMRRAVLTILLTAVLAFAQGATASDGAGVTSLFASGAGGRALGMGGANVALGNDASAIFWNPATLTSLAGRTFSFMYLPLPEKTQYSFAALAWPTVDYGSFSLAAFLLTTDGIERRDDNGRPLGEFGANEQMYLIGYGKSLNRHVAFGATVKLFGQSFDNTSSFGAGGDLGIKLSLSDNLALGFNAQNIVAPKLRLNRDSESLPVNFKTGLGITIPFSDGRNHVAVEFDVDKTDNVDPAYHAGAELGFLGHYFIRGGYDIDQVNLGAGIRIGSATFGYAFRTQDYFEAQHRVTLDLSFGGSIESILAKREAEKRQEAERLAAVQRENELTYARGQAKALYENGRYDSAVVYYQRVSLLTDGGDAEAAKRISEIESRRSEQLAAAVRAGVLAETDSLKAEELFAELSEAIALKDVQSAQLLIERLRPAFGADPRFQEREAGFQVLVNERINALSREAARLTAEARLAEAALRYDEILQLKKDDVAAGRNLKAINDRIQTLTLFRSGIAASNAGDTVTARADLERLLAINPNDSAAIGLLQLLNAEQGVGASSLADIRKDAAMWKTYLEGIEKFRDGDYDGAIKLWQQVLVAFPGNKETEKNIEQAKLRLPTSGASD